MPTYQTIYLLKADDTHYPQTPRDDNDKDKYTQKDKYKDKDAGNSSVPVLMYIGCNALISYVWWCLMHVWSCLVVSDACLVVSRDVWWCLMVSDARLVVSDACLVVSDACLVVSGGV